MDFEHGHGPRSSRKKAALQITQIRSLSGSDRTAVYRKLAVIIAVWRKGNPCGPSFIQVIWVNLPMQQLMYIVQFLH